MIYEVSSMMFHAKSQAAQEMPVHAVLDLTRRRILANPDIPKHIKQKLLLVMMTPIEEKKPRQTTRTLPCNMKLTQTIIIGLTGLLSSLVWAKDASIQTGYFIDAPVTGLHYQTSSDLHGTTDKGAFQFRRGDVISFFLGQGEERYLLSTVSAQEVITPTAISTKPSRSINITRLLLSLDATPKRPARNTATR
ncbi:hypothetical protein QW180_10345 [Vibrio sinaloensis]|nr:hypothetical protein [Vibrio sinaloensis]